MESNNESNEDKKLDRIASLEHKLKSARALLSDAIDDVRGHLDPGDTSDAPVDRMATLDALEEVRLILDLDLESSPQDQSVYIETERAAQLDSRGIPLVRDAAVLVVCGTRFHLESPLGAAVAEAAVLRALSHSKGEAQLASDTKCRDELYVESTWAEFESGVWTVHMPERIGQYVVSGRDCAGTTTRTVYLDPNDGVYRIADACGWGGWWWSVPIPCDYGLPLPPRHPRSG